MRRDKAQIELSQLNEKLKKKSSSLRPKSDKQSVHTEGETLATDCVTCLPFTGRNKSWHTMGKKGKIQSPKKQGPEQITVCPSVDSAFLMVVVVVLRK